PKLYYLGADDAAITPGVAERSQSYLWSERPTESNSLLSLSRPLINVEPTAPAAREPADEPTDTEARDEQRDGTKGRIAKIREVYDVYHAQPWGRKVSGYLWTKSIASGALLVAALAALLGPSGGKTLNVVAPLIGLVF